MGISSSNDRSAPSIVGTGETSPSFRKYARN
jgi:hypothetical protein